MYHGFVRMAAAVPVIRIADCRYNTSEIVRLACQAEQQGAQAVCFPELCITGYTCGDLFFQHHLQRQALAALAWLQEQTKTLNTAIIAGMPLRSDNRLLNTAVVLQQGRILGVVPKTNMPNNSEFHEKRWFASAREAACLDSIEINGEYVPLGANLIFNDGSMRFAIEICEDIWLPIPPSAQHVLHGADVIFNLSASTEMVAKSAYRHQMLKVHSRRCMAGYVYVSCGAGESSSDTVFGGDTFFAENGHIVACLPRFAQQSQLLISEIDIDVLRYERSRNTNFEGEKNTAAYRTIMLNKVKESEITLTRKVEPFPFVPSDAAQLAHNCSEVFSIQTAALAQRWRHTAAKSVVVGVSGGMDSALALLVCVKTADILGCDRHSVIAVSMPCFGTTERTRSNADKLAEALGVTFRQIDIKAACLQHFRDIGHNPDNHNAVYENAQARERTQVLMDIANAQGGMVIGTGDMSELALGWATYGGDLSSMYGVNAGVPKTLIPHLLAWIASEMGGGLSAILSDIVATPISPELLPSDNADDISQKTEDIVGPYELHDFFLFYMLRFGIAPAKLLFLARCAFAGRYDGAVLEKWLRVFLQRFFSMHYKRSSLPDSPKIGTVCLGREWQMAGDCAYIA
jgi:NAD+ synthase (glutamine-hydrolysing)